MEDEMLRGFNDVQIYEYTNTRIYEWEPEYLEYQNT